VAAVPREDPLRAGTIAQTEEETTSVVDRESRAQHSLPAVAKEPPGSESFGALVASHLKPAPPHLQAAALRLAEVQHRWYVTKFQGASPDSTVSILSWQDDAYMMRLTELAMEGLKQGRGLLVVEGLAPDAESGLRHFYKVPVVETRFGRQIGVLVDLDAPDEQLAASDSACRELRIELAGQKVLEFNARPETERRTALARYLDAKQRQVGFDWSLFGLSPGEEIYVSVDDSAALLALKLR